MPNNAALETWAQDVLHAQLDRAGDAVASYCRKPRSAKRLHDARKALARLRSALDDLGALAGVAPEFAARVHELHRRAGKVRDADVLLQRVSGYARMAFGEEAAQLQIVRSALRKRRKRGRRKLESVVATTAPELHG